jgi:outer membrane lipoprotein LolB
VNPRLVAGAYRAGLLLALLALAGCPALAPRPPAEQPWELRRVELQSLQDYAFRGRVAVAAGQEGFNARLRWEQAGPRSDLALDGPLGVGGVRLAAHGEQLRLTTPRGEELDADAARVELQARFGFSPPLASLRYWVLGVPDPAVPAAEVLDELERLAALEQDGWRVEYTQYTSAGGRWLPQRLSLRRGDVRVRLIVDGWTS